MSFNDTKNQNTEYSMHSLTKQSNIRQYIIIYYIFTALAFPLVTSKCVIPGIRRTAEHSAEYSAVLNITY